MKKTDTKIPMIIVRIADLFRFLVVEAEVFMAMCYQLLFIAEPRAFYGAVVQKRYGIYYSTTVQRRKHSLLTGSVV